MATKSFSALQILLGRTLLKPFYDFYLRCHWLRKFPNAWMCFNIYPYSTLDISVGDRSTGEAIDIVGIGNNPTKIKIGSDVGIAPNVAFVARDHNKECNLEIGDKAWIGYGAILLMSLKIGKGATIAAGAVVTHDVKPYDVVAGVPAKSIKNRADKD